MQCSQGRGGGSAVLRMPTAVAPCATPTPCPTPCLQI